MKKALVLIALFVSSCSLLSLLNFSEPVCYNAPDEFRDAPKIDCLSNTRGATCCGYGFLPEGSSGPLCYYLVCQEKPCGEWAYYDVQCAQPPPSTPADKEACYEVEDRYSRDH